MPLSRTFTTAVVDRLRLLRRLDAASSFPIVLVVAPAGYGKTTLITHWVQTLTSPIAWVPLSSTASDIGAFCAAISQALAIPTPSPSLDAILNHLREDQEPGGISLVLDDYHVVESQDVHDAMNGFLARLPAGVRIILTSRTQPPLALSRLRVQGQIAELTAQDLRFTEEELVQLVEHLAPVSLTSEQIGELHLRTEGWIAGVRLLLAALPQTDPADVQAVLDAGSAHRWLDDYVVEEVLRHLPRNIRDFVLRTAFLEWLTPDLCDAVLETETSASMLGTMVQHVAFVRPHSAARGALAYHALFAASVQRIAEREDPRSTIRERHRRAAAWLETHGYLDTAIDHAVAAEDWETVLRCVRIVGCPLHDGDHHHPSLRLLRKVPEHLVLADPHLARWYLAALLYRGDMAHAGACFARVDPEWQASGDPAQLGYSAMCHAFFTGYRGQRDLSHRYVIEAVHHLPLDCHVERMHAWATISIYESLAGNDEVAGLAYRQAVAARSHLPALQRWWTLRVEVYQANLQALRGNLQAAEQAFRDDLERLPVDYRAHEGKLRMGLAAIYLEQDRLDEAMQEVERIEDDIATFPYHIWYPDALMIAARVYVAAGNVERHDATLLRVRRMYEQYGDPSVLRRLDIMEAIHWLRTGQMDRLRSWTTHQQPEHLPWLNVFGDPDPRLVYIRQLLATNQATRANQLLQDWIAQGIRLKRWAELVSLSALQVVVAQELGDEGAMTTSLQEALRLARQGTFRRSLRVRGYDLRPILARVWSRLHPDDAAYALQVLGATPAIDGADEPQDPVQRINAGIAMALSPRERDVLALLRLGLTNKAIAARLYIAERTAEKHVVNIMRKLNAPNRTAAVAIARHIGEAPDT